MTESEIVVFQTKRDHYQVLGIEKMDIIQDEE